MTRLLAIVILGGALIYFVIQTENGSKELRRTNAAILNDGIGSAKGSLYVANDILEGGIIQRAKHLTMADAAVYVAQSAGALTSIRTAAHYDEVDHLSGIAMELQQVSFQMTHPQHFANSIKSDETFIKVVEKELQSSIKKGRVNKAILNNVIPKIYHAMSQQDSKMLYDAT